jgi:hypothetical protein
MGFPYFQYHNLKFDDSPQLYGLRFVLEDADGWDSPDVEVESIPRAESDGSFVTKGRYTHREVLLRGSAYGKTLQAPWLARQVLMSNFGGAVRGPRTLKFVMAPNLTPIILNAHLNGRLRTERTGPYSISFEVPLMAPDPRKYTETEKVATWTLPAGAQEATWPVQVGGNYNTFWTAVIVGNINLPRIKNLTQAGEPYIAVDLQVNPGDTLAISSRDRTVLHNTANRYDALNLNLSRWFPLAGGRTNYIRFARQSAGWFNATITMRWRDAWI